MKEYQTITEISGPLVFAEVDEPIGYDEIVEIETPTGDTMRGQVLESSDGLVSIQVFEGTEGINRESSVRFLGETHEDARDRGPPRSRARRVGTANRRRPGNRPGPT